MPTDSWASAFYYGRLRTLSEEDRPLWTKMSFAAAQHGVIAGRAKTGGNGATWQVATVQALQERGMTRPDALAEMLRLYCQRMHSNEPVHTWEIAD